MKILSGIVICLGLSANCFGKAPVVENHSLQNRHRVPAQISGLNIKPLEFYMDLSCEQLVSISEKDGFSRYLKSELNKLDSDFCTLVGEIDGEGDFSQASQSKVGLGTFSKLVEGHYDEYSSVVELDYYQDMSCSEYMKSSEDNSFAAFFKSQLMDLDSGICERIGDFDAEDGRDKIGLGTYSKMVESAFTEFKSMSFRY